jgi:hypothetical protein
MSDKILTETIKKPKRKSTALQFIPDISYHLIFRFLRIKQLSLIARCSKEFRRLVTNKSFINMYSSKEVIKINDLNKMISMIESSFKTTLQNIEFNYISLFDVLPWIANFTNLKNLKLNATTNCYNRRNPVIHEKIEMLTQNSPPSQSLNNLIIELRDFEHLYYNNKLYDESLFSLFQNLTVLDLRIPTYIFNLINISIVNHLKKLANLTILFVGNDDHSADAQVIDTVRLLPSIKVLDANGLFRFDNENKLLNIGLKNLRRLCAQPGAPACLTAIHSKHWPAADNIPHENYQNEVVQLLQQLPALNEFSILGFCCDSIPTFLAPWTKDIEIYKTIIVSQHIKEIFQFSRIESISLIYCSITTDLLVNLIRIHTTRLKKFLFEGLLEHIPFLSAISECSQLYHLEIRNCKGLQQTKDLQILHKCKQLKFLRLFDCGFHFYDLDSNYYQNELPSQVFQALKFANYG